MTYSDDEIFLMKLIKDVIQGLLNMLESGG